MTQASPGGTVTPSDVSGLSSRLAILEHEVIKPQGVIALLSMRVKYLEERKTAKSVERGNKIFKDQRAVEAFVMTTGDTHLYRYCLDMVSLITLVPDPFFSVAEGMAGEAAAVKAPITTLYWRQGSLCPIR